MIEKFTFRFKDLDISPLSLIKVMGYSPDSIPSPAEEIIHEVLNQGDSICHIDGGYRIINSCTFDKDTNNLSVENINLNINRIILQQLKKAEQIAVFVCTAGMKISELSKQFMYEGDLLKGYVYDVLGSVTVEKAMDIIQEKLQQKMLNDNMKITNRYSPGYCSWDVSEQKQLFKLLPEKFCGVELTDTCLMKPIKSVSGIIGIGKSVKLNSYTCDICDSVNCLYRNLKSNKSHT